MAKRLPFVTIAGMALLLQACQPPAADAYSERGEALPKGREAPTTPVAAPDMAGAIWAPSLKAPPGGARLLYGLPGKPPELAITCLREEGAAPVIRIARFAATDPDAQALMAIIGNGHTTRLPVDAVKHRRAWLWQGDYPASEPQLDALTGVEDVALTIPGAGTLQLGPSTMPGRLIEACRGNALSGDAGDEDEAEVPVANDATPEPLLAETPG